MDQKLSLVLKIEKNIPKTVSVFEKKGHNVQLEPDFCWEKGIAAYCFDPPIKDER